MTGLSISLIGGQNDGLSIILIGGQHDRLVLSINWIVEQNY